MIRSDVLYMIKRRAKGAALPYSTCCHTFRATGIIAYLQNGGTLEQCAANRRPLVAPHHETLRSDQRCNFARRGRTN